MRYGVIKILPNDRRGKATIHPNPGRPYFHTELLPYSDNEHMARIREDEVVVTNRRGDEVHVVPARAFILLDYIIPVRVWDGGWLFRIGEDRRDKVNFLLRLERGEVKTRFTADKSAHFRVSCMREGQELTLLYAKDADKSQVVDEYRQIVPLEVLYPMADGEGPLRMPDEDD